MACLSAAELEALPPATRMLELGCGPVKRWKNSVAIDINPRSIADVIHDLNVTPYPFADGEFDIIIAEHVMEHLGNLVNITGELHRILKPGGRLCVEVPHFSSANFFTDPTHTHAFSSRSFDYYDPSCASLYSFHYSNVDFKKLEVTLGGSQTGAFARFIHKHSNAHKQRFERDFAFMFPRETINFVLEAVK